MSSDTPSESLDVNGMVEVVTGGAGGGGKPWEQEPNDSTRISSVVGML